MRIVLPRDQVGGAHRFVIEVQVEQGALVAGIGPFPSGIDFIVHDPVVDSAMLLVRAAVAPGQKIQRGGISLKTCFAGDIGHGVNAGRVRIGMSGEPAPFAVG